jgi:hypothetical protein
MGCRPSPYDVSRVATDVKSGALEIFVAPMPFQGCAWFNLINQLSVDYIEQDSMKMPYIGPTPLLLLWLGASSKPCIVALE